MNKICFIEPPYHMFMESLDAPFTLMYLAAIAEKLGWQAEIVDMPSHDAPLPEADIYAVTSSSPQWPAAVDLSIRLKNEFPDAMTLVGGNHISAEPSDVVRSAFDHAVLGEGEQALYYILKAYPRSKEWSRLLPGEPVFDLDTIPFPARHLVDWGKYKRGIFWGHKRVADAVSMITSRGCPYNCVSEDTRVVTEKGLVKIKDIKADVTQKPGHISFTYLKTPFGYCDTVWYRGIRDCLRITLNNGIELVATPDHKILAVKNGKLAFEQIAKLREGDFVATSCGEDMWGKEKLDLDMAWLVGFLIGDGYIGYNKGYRLMWGVQKHLLQKLIDVLSCYTKNKLTIYPHSLTDKIIQVQVYDKKLYEFLTSIVGIDPKDKLKVPEKIFRCNRDAVEAFIDGLWDADGTVDCVGHTYLTTISKTLASGVHQLLLNLGHNAAIYGPYGPYESLGKHPTYRVVKNLFKDVIPTERRVYRSTKSGNYYYRTKIKTRRGVTRELLKRSGLPNKLLKPNIIYSQVKTIEPHGESGVYDISVPQTKRFSANGIIVHNCCFCGSHVVFGRRTRFRSIDNVVEEIRQVKNTLGYNGLNFHDDTFAINQNRTVDMCKALNKLDVVWRCLTRANTITKELLEWLVHGGCKESILGIESFSQKILNNLNKRTTVQQNKNAMRLFTENPDIQVKVGIIVGSPGETWETIKETADALREYPPDFWNVNVFTPYPGCDVWRNPEKYDIRILSRDLSDYAMVGLDYRGNVNVETSGMTKQDIEQARDMLIELLLEVSGPQYDHEVGKNP